MLVHFTKYKAKSLKNVLNILHKLQTQLNLKFLKQEVLTKPLTLLFADYHNSWQWTLSFMTFMERPLAYDKHAVINKEEKQG